MLKNKKIASTNNLSGNLADIKPLVIIPAVNKSGSVEGLNSVGSSSHGSVTSSLESSSQTSSIDGFSSSPSSVKPVGILKATRDGFVSPLSVKPVGVIKSLDKPSGGAHTSAFSKPGVVRGGVCSKHGDSQDCRCQVIFRAVKGKYSWGIFPS